MKLPRKTLALLLAASFLVGCAKEGQEVSAPGPDSLPASAASQPESGAEAPAPVTLSLPLPAEGISATSGLAAAHAGQRPVAVMLYNTKACWPQWGIDSADLLIEANTEGQGSHLMAVYEGYEAVEKAGPVGPARDVFLQFVLPFQAIPMFNGSDVYTSNLLNVCSYQPLDGNYVGVSGFDYDSSRRGIYKSEYGWYAHKALIPTALELYGQSTAGQTPSLFSFVEGSAPQNGNGTALEIGYGTERVALLEYDGSRYVMKEAGQLQQDANTPDQPVGYDNVLLLMAKYDRKDDGVTYQYDLTEGTGLYLSKGGSEVIRWRKGGAMQPLKLFAQDGSERSIEPGQTYLGIWGGFEGQTLKLYDWDWKELPLPEAPGAMTEPSEAAPESTAEAASTSAPASAPASVPASAPVSVPESVPESTSQTAEEPAA